MTANNFWIKEKIPKSIKTDSIRMALNTHDHRSKPLNPHQTQIAKLRASQLKNWLISLLEMNMKAIGENVA